MSPNTYFYNRDEQSRQYLISEIRGLYAFIFNEIVQLYKFYYPNEKGLSTKADDVGKLISGSLPSGADSGFHEAEQHQGRGACGGDRTRRSGFRPENRRLRGQRRAV